MPDTDDRTPDRRAADEALANAPRKPLPKFPPDAPTRTTAEIMAAKRLGPYRHAPMAVAGVVTGGAVRPVDPAVRLPENARVVIVAGGASGALTTPPSPGRP